MTQTQLNSRIARHALDFTIGLVLFFILTGAFSVSQSGAFPAPPPDEMIAAASSLDAASTAVQRPVDTVAFRAASAAPAMEPAQSLAKILLALAFAGLTTLNLGLLRHLRRAYVAPRTRS